MFDAPVRCQLNGYGCDKDIPNAIPVIEDAMNKGCTRARTTFAACLVNGIGVVKSPELAVPLLQQSIAEGHGKAMNNLVALLQFSDTPKSETHRYRSSAISLPPQKLQKQRLFLKSRPATLH